MLLHNKVLEYTLYNLRLMYTMIQWQRFFARGVYIKLIKRANKSSVLFHTHGTIDE